MVAPLSAYLFLRGGGMSWSAILALVATILSLATVVAVSWRSWSKSLRPMSSRNRMIANDAKPYGDVVHLHSEARFSHRRER